MYFRIEEAFAFLEALASCGEIQGYGVSGNFLSCYFSVSGRPNSYEALDLQQVLGAAKDARRRKEEKPGKTEDDRPGFFQDTHFVGIQTPFNLLEGGAVAGRKGVPGFSGEPDFEVCKRLGISFMGNRPLQGIEKSLMQLHGKMRPLMQFQWRTPSFPIKAPLYAIQAARSPVHEYANPTPISARRRSRNPQNPTPIAARRCRKNPQNPTYTNCSPQM